MRLEYRSGVRFGAYNGGFQFHKGAIGVTGTVAGITKAMVFQFHNGAIGVRLKNRLIDVNKAVLML